MRKMSLQLTLANAEQRAADERWRWHKLGCPGCSSAQHSRKPEQMCSGGIVLYSDLKARERELAEERRLERMPLAGQEGLFGEDEVVRVERKAQGA